MAISLLTLHIPLHSMAESAVESQAPLLPRSQGSTAAMLHSSYTQLFLIHYIYHLLPKLFSVPETSSSSGQPLQETGASSLIEIRAYISVLEPKSGCLHLWSGVACATLCQVLLISFPRSSLGPVAGHSAQWAGSACLAESHVSEGDRHLQMSTISCTIALTPYRGAMGSHSGKRLLSPLYSRRK